jgi:selenocysteine lyase/cysteine desulfurase
VYKRLVAEGVAASHRRNRDGVDFLRLSPHFYNTFEEIDRVASLLSF